jgi:hypothetical protein
MQLERRAAHDAKMQKAEEARNVQIGKVASRAHLESVKVQENTFIREVRRHTHRRMPSRAVACRRMPGGDGFSSHAVACLVLLLVVVVVVARALRVCRRAPARLLSRPSAPEQRW